MAEPEHVVVARSNQPSKAYQASSVMKRCNAEGRIGLRDTAVVERTPQGELRMTDGTTSVGPVGTASESLIGVLGGPVSVLLGWGAGAWWASTLFKHDRPTQAASG